MKKKFPVQKNYFSQTPADRNRLQLSEYILVNIKEIIFNIFD